MDAPSAPPRRRRGYLLPGGIALAVMAVLAVLVDLLGLHHHTPTTLAGPDVAHEIALGLQAADGAHRAPEVSCPPSEPVRDGYVFTCQAVLAPGAPARTVQVTEGPAATFRFSLVALG